MATQPAASRVEKPSFAKVCAATTARDLMPEDNRADLQQIAASGLPPPSTQQTHNNNVNDSYKHGITSAPRTNASIGTPANGMAQRGLQIQPKKLVQLAAKNLKDSDANAKSGLEVHVHDADGMSKKSQDLPAAEGLLAPGTSDDAHTQVSSSSDSGKPPSLDGKSVASGTTFALDEKESLRPDDSASAKAAEDEDIFSPPTSLPPGSHIGSEEGVRAFRDQLREISSMEPPRRSITPQAFTPCSGSNQGVLYVPPPGPGIGLVPGAMRSTNESTSNVDVQPDTKLLEALESPRDRIWVLKLEQDIYDFVKDAKEASLNLPQCNAYHRMLAHRIADYYMLGHIVDDSASAVRLFKTPDCRIPPPLTGITTPSTAASTPPPSAQPMKILRRGVDGGPANANGSGFPSKTNSEDGDDDGKPKPPPSREEKEARYEAARLRIMGSAKPVDSLEEFRAKDDSRSSSAAGKKKTRKQRSDSDDGFEARSAYSAYYTQTYSANGLPAPSYGYQSFNEQAHGPPQSQGYVQGQDSNVSTQQFAGQSAGGMAWSGQGFAASSDPQQWGQAQHQQSLYDLSSDFQRAMALQAQTPPMQAPTPHMSAGYSTGYQPQYYGHPQPWQQPDYQMSMQAPQPGYGPPPNYVNRPSSSSSQAHGLQPYAYGQLPSQTFPGRPPNRLEHPLPGSYKSKHFNPQSQSFVPGHTSSPSLQPSAPPGPSPSATGYAGSFAMPSPLQRQASSHSHTSTFGSPHHSTAAIAQPMMHPLPQPVFLRQPSPSMPLPPKPGQTPPKPMTPQFAPQAPQGPANSPSSIAKWGAPSSLPAKPPPPAAEPYDPARYPQPPRQPSYSTAASARLPNGGMPSFGSMPPPMAGGIAVNGSGGQPGRRV